MERREFIKGSAIIGAVTTLPALAKFHSGLFSSETHRKVYRILKADATFVGTLPIMRAFAGNHSDYVSPFVLFDEFGPVTMQAGQKAFKVEAHPHAGVTPTSYFIEGSGHHKDSLEYDFQVNTGEFMMFNSGRGAIHMEESGRVVVDNGGTVHGFQIWLNMPSSHKFDSPSTVVHTTSDMPEIVHEDFSVKIVLGELFGVASSVQTLTPAFYYHIKLKENKRLDIHVNESDNAFVYVVNGEIETADQVLVKKHQIALYERGKSEMNFYSVEGSEFFLLGGQPLNEIVYSYGPFVMNNEDQIRQCINNYNLGKMGDPDIVNR